MHTSRSYGRILALVHTAVVRKSLILLQCNHCDVLKKGFGRSSGVVNSILAAYGRIGCVADARAVFDEMSMRNVVAETMMVSIYMCGGMVGNAIVVFEQMHDRDLPAWNALIVGCVRNRFYAEGMRFFKRMVWESVPVNRTTLSSVLSACGHLGMLHVGKSVHAYAYRVQFWFLESVVNALIDMYGKCGYFTGAGWIFENLSGKSLISWNMMINCFARHGRNADVIKTFNRMIAKNVNPDEITFVGLLNACAHGGYVDEGLIAFQLMRDKYKIEPKAEHYGCIVDLLGRAGHLQKAIKVIKNVRMEHDEVMWGSLLNACNIHSNKEVAEFASRNLQNILRLSTKIADI